MIATPIRIEAEKMTRVGYRLEKNNKDASGRALASLFAQGSSETAFLRTAFNGTSGLYDIVIAYFDENDGESSFSFSRNGNDLDDWKASRTSGGKLPTAQALVRRTISNVNLLKGDLLQLTGTEDAGEAARVDYIEFLPKSTQPAAPNNPAAPAAAGPTIRVEAEKMSLSGYRTEKSNNDASGRALTSLYAKGATETGSATTTFNGASGTYDIVVAYFDEDDGASSFNVKKNGSTVDSWVADNTNGGRLPTAQALVRRVISNVSLSQGDSIRITGTEDAGEAARVDYLEFVAAGTGQPTTPTTPTGPVAAIRVEAEKMSLSGYRTEKSNNDASGRALTSLYAKGATETGSATTTFNGASGTYDIVVAYFDEDDGASSFNVKKNGSTVDSWVADNTNGGRLPTAQALVRRVISNVSLSQGDSIRITGTEDAGEAARVDYLEFVAAGTGQPTTPTTPTGPVAAIRVEAEKMSLSGYRTEKSNNDASGRALTSLYAKGATETGSATTTFNGASGTYDIVVAYFDEDDGASSFNVKKNGSTVDSWVADNTNGGRLPTAQALVRRVISNVSLSQGDSIRITGTEDAGEAARVDYLEFVAAGTGQPTTPTTPTDGGSNGVIEIMALGDSITRGEDAVTPKAQQNGYRDDLSARLNSAGIKFDFVGSQDNGSGFDSDHEGHGGWKISQLSSNVSGWLQSYRPEVIVLKIGTNDMGFSNASVGNAINQLSGLINKITAKRPSAKLIVSSIAPVNPANFSNPAIKSNFAQRVAQFNAQIPGLVSGKGSNVSFADAYGALGSNDLSSDGFHPNNAGYSKLGQVYFNAIKKVTGTTTSPSAALQSSSSPNSTSAVQNDALTGTPSSGPNLNSTAQNDVLIGTSGNDRITGGLGNDILTGNKGRDRFFFNSAQEGRDTITDFTGNDRIIISARGFGGGLRGGTGLRSRASSVGTFVSGDQPISLGSRANFLFDTSSNVLSFDKDGVGGSNAVAIAELTGFSGLTASQIKITA